MPQQDLGQLNAAADNSKMQRRSVLLILADQVLYNQTRQSILNMPAHSRHDHAPRGIGHDAHRRTAQWHNPVTTGTIKRIVESTHMACTPDAVRIQKWQKFVQ